MTNAVKTVAIALALLAIGSTVSSEAASTRRHHRAAASGRSSPRLGARSNGPVGNDASPAGAASRTMAAPGGEDGGAGGFGQVGNPYSQAGYGAGTFGDGRRSR